MALAWRGSRITRQATTNRNLCAGIDCGFARLLRVNLLEARYFIFIERRNERLSHIVTIQTQVRDPAAVAAACQRLGLPVPVHRIVHLFNGAAEGLAVELPGWHYPLVCDPASGGLKYDNYGGAWNGQT